MSFVTYFSFLLAFTLQLNLLDAKIFIAKHPECRNGTNVNIALMGDSLNHRPYAYLKMPNKILGALQKINPYLHYNLSYFETAADGSKILDILNQQVQPVCNQSKVPGFKFDTILMFWDTG